MIEKTLRYKCGYQKSFALSIYLNRMVVKEVVLFSCVYMVLFS